MEVERLFESELCSDSGLGEWEKHRSGGVVVCSLVGQGECSWVLVVFRCKEPLAGGEFLGCGDISPMQHPLCERLLPLCVKFLVHRCVVV